MTKRSAKISFNLEGSEDSPILNPCFVIKNWGSEPKARIKINNNKPDAGIKVKQGIIRDTDGSKTLIIWIEQKSYEDLLYSLY